MGLADSAARAGGGDLAGRRGWRERRWRGGGGEGLAVAAVVGARVAADWERVVAGLAAPGGEQGGGGLGGGAAAAAAEAARGGGGGDSAAAARAGGRRRSDF